MDFFEAVERRRSVRIYTSKSVPESVINKAIDAAILAPNSSNMQSWGFYWVREPNKKSALVKACLNQSAARTAQELVVIVATTNQWKRNNQAIIKSLRERNSNNDVLNYYEKMMPFVYGFRILSPLKWLIYNILGIFNPMVRGPATPRDIQEVSIKSAALASENFMLAITAQGFDTCPMEGMDETRVKKNLISKLQRARSHGDFCRRTRPKRCLG